MAVGMKGGDAVAGGSGGFSVMGSWVSKMEGSITCVEAGSCREVSWLAVVDADGGVALAKFTPPGAMKSGAPDSRGVKAQAQLDPSRIQAMKKGKNSLAFDLIFWTAAFPGLD